MSQLLIFDWDGTLSDSLSRIAHCMQLSAIDCGVEPPTDKQVHEIVGLGLREALVKLYPGVRDETLIERLKLGYSQHFMDSDRVPSDLYPHVMESLTQLRDQGHILAVATGKSRQGLDRVLAEKGLSDFFHASRCADETQSKPHPQMLSELLQRFDIPVERALMVGDTEYDMEMAQRIDMPRLAMSYGAHSADRLLRYQPLACLDCFSGVGEVVASRQLTP